MEKKSFTNYRFLIGLGLVFIGIFLFAVFNGTIRYVGIFFVFLSFLYFFSSFIPKVNKSKDDQFRSRTRDRMRKHQHRKS